MTRGFTRNALEYPERLLQPIAPSLFLRESAPLAFQFHHPTLRSRLHQRGLPSSAKVFERVAPAPDRRGPTPPVLTVQQLRPYMKSLVPACDRSSNLDGTFNVRCSMLDVGRSAFGVFCRYKQKCSAGISVEAAVSAATPTSECRRHACRYSKQKPRRTLPAGL